MVLPIGLRALAEDIVQLQEIDDPVPAVAEQLVEAPGMDVHEGAVGGKPGQQGVKRKLDQHDGRRFQRLEKAGR